LFCQDWGGLIGLRLVGENPDPFARVVASNTFLPTGDGSPSEAFLAWQKYSQETPVFNVGRIIDGATVSHLTPAVIAGYDAPFPDDTFKAGARRFPMLVPTSPDDPAAPANRAAWAALGHYDKPFLCAFSDSDPVTRGGDALLASHIPGARNHPAVTIENAGHFLQEDKGEELARIVSSFISATP
jgi:haloalkane dehalogenase